MQPVDRSQSQIAIGRASRDCEHAVYFVGVGGVAMENLAQLEQLNSHSIVQQLQLRYQRDLPYVCLLLLP